MRSVLLLTCLCASPVLADCPTAADLSRGGILVTETDGTTNLFTALGDGIVQNDGRVPDGFMYRNLLAQGTHLIELGDTNGTVYVDDSKRVVTYPTDPARLPIPTANSRWEVDTTITDTYGSYPENQKQSWGAMTTLTIGDCTYDMIPAKVTYTNVDYTVFEGLHYLPDLELALLYTYQTQGEEKFTYTAARIEAVQ